MATDIRKAQYLVSVTQHLPQFLQLVGIIGSKNYLFHFSKQSYYKLRSTRIKLMDIYSIIRVILSLELVIQRR